MLSYFAGQNEEPRDVIQESVREWSRRRGKSVSGWWIDGCYFAGEMHRFDDEPNFASFARTLKAGNPEAIVAFNPNVKVPRRSRS